MGRTVGGVVVAASLLMMACFGEDPILVGPSSELDGGAADPDGSSASDAGAVGPDGVAPDAPDPFAGVDAGNLPCDPNEAISDGALYVAADGAPDGDGTAIAPFKTLAAALANLAGSKVVIVAEGTYPSAKLTLRDAHAGVTIRGGYVRSGAQWSKNCANGAPERTLVSSTDAVAVDVAFGAEAAPIMLESLTLATKVAGAASGASVESTYGVFAHGAGTKLVLRGVNLRAGRGASPTAPAVPAPTTGQVTCDGVTSCSSGAGGGTPGVGAPHAANPGTYGASGFVGAGGATGGGGNPGANGKGGTEDPGVTNCAFCGGDPCKNLGTDPEVRRGTKGKCGCGGVGGVGGPGGSGGGASVGIFASGAGVEVRLEIVAVVTTGGGKGAEGSGGGEGAPGGKGAKGGATQCAATCKTAGAGMCESSLKYSSGGAPGGPGGHGSAGAKGGSGAGGDSLGVVAHGGAAVDVPSSGVAFKIGPAGEGGVGAAPGREDDTLFLP